MSGKPYPQGVSAAIRLLDEISAADSEMLELQAAAEQEERRVQALKERRRVAWDEYSKLMRDMDVSMEGNYGFEVRAAWFLAEMRRQVSAKKE